jgi:hypothetical protein
MNDVHKAAEFLLSATLVNNPNPSSPDTFLSTVPRNSPTTTSQVKREVFNIRNLGNILMSMQTSIAQLGHFQSPCENPALSQTIFDRALDTPITISQ